MPTSAVSPVDGPVVKPPRKRPSALEKARKTASARRAGAVLVSSRAVGADEALSEPVIEGRTVPRLWTRPLVELAPETSFGFAVIEFARDILRAPLDPWQEWVVIHAGELLPSGRPRFRQVLVMVSRQNGKSHLAVVMSLFWLFVEQVPLVLGTSTKLPYAAETWEKAIKLAQKRPELAAEIPAKGGIRRAHGTEHLRLLNDSRYLIAASTDEGGRSLTIDRLILDELRQHHDYSAWDAATPATNSVPDAQIWCLSNAGSDRSVVLNDLRDTAVKHIEGKGPDTGLFLAEYSAAPGALPTDVEALAQANPNLNRRLPLDVLLNSAEAAVAKGGAKLSGFMTEYMCIRVAVLNPAVNPAKWSTGLVPGTLTAVRARVALCLDVSIDQQHATLVAAAVLDDGRVRIEEVGSWAGVGCTQQVRRDLPALVAKIRPKAFGWLPAGPAASLAADLAVRKGRPWPPAGVKVEEIRGETTAVCMGFVDGIDAELIVHSGQPLLDTQIGATEKLMQGDAYRFTRKGVGHCDASYAAAGAVHLARTLPKGPGRPRVIAVPPTS